MIRGVNLIPSARLQARRLRRRVRTWIVATSAWAGLLLCACVGGQLLIGIRAVAESELENVKAKNAELRTKTTEMNRQIFEADGARRAAEALADQPDWSILLNGLAKLTGDDLILREVHLIPEKAAATAGGSTPSATAAPQSPSAVSLPSAAPSAARSVRYELLIRGMGRQQQAVSQFVVRLQQMGVFDDVRLTRSGREPFKNGSVISFDVTCWLSEPEGGGP